MDFKQLMGIGLLLALSLSAVGKPAYLKCKLDGNDKSFDVTVDEELGRVTQGTMPVFDKAKFSATEINYERESGRGVSALTEEYAIDRSTLAYRSVWIHWGIQQDGKPKENRAVGRCEVAVLSERKI